MKLLGFDIGGTKCAVIIGDYTDGNIKITAKEKMPTDHGITPYEMIDRLIATAKKMLSGDTVDKIGISCGGPLDSDKGVILSPPNLPKWDNIEIVARLEAAFGVKAVLQNDANACVVAEWKFGAGKGCKNCVFLTFGTGLGAGFILDGHLYGGTNGNAGEVGHMRLEPTGPIGFGKSGSFEGFCSGGGLAQLGYSMALDAIKEGKTPLYYNEDKTKITAKTIEDAVNSGDETAKKVYEVCGSYLGKGLSVIIDFLNPEKIIIGSIFTRSEYLLREKMEEQIKAEALGTSAAVCEIVPALLGESIGDYAALGAALSD